MGSIKYNNMIKIKNNKGILSGRYRFKTFKAGTKELIRQTDWIKNLIVSNDNNGLNLVLQELNAQTTYDLAITQAKIGTGDTAPVDGNTDLETPTSTVGDILVATRVLTTDDLTLGFFISDAQLPEGEYKEFGLFCGEQLFARSLISPTYTKSIGEDTTCEYVIEVTNV